MTETRIFDALVELTRTVRPHWDTPGIRHAIRAALARPVQPSVAELAYALIRCAENPTIATPAVVAMDGAHWGKSTKDPEEPMRSIRCDRCAEFHPPTTGCPDWANPRSSDDQIRRHQAAINELRRIAREAKRPVDRTAKPTTTDTPLPDVQPNPEEQR